MIGEPTNFIHLTHIGSGEMTEGLQPSGSVQEQMRSKGPNMNGRNTEDHRTENESHCRLFLRAWIKDHLTLKTKGKDYNSQHALQHLYI
ncbi:CDC42 small effector protein 1 [Scomber scombrus]|uniref:CDC42 small effector protein 1 n=1 Tax=Scomber scombrus TaxID=13677 RepID=A0AAV1QD40_SCOSC